MELQTTEIELRKKIVDLTLEAFEKGATTKRWFEIMHELPRLIESDQNEAGDWHERMILFMNTAHGKGHIHFCCDEGFRLDVLGLLKPSVLRSCILYHMNTDLGDENHNLKTMLVRYVEMDYKDRLEVISWFHDFEDIGIKEAFLNALHEYEEIERDKLREKKELAKDVTQ